MSGCVSLSLFTNTKEQVNSDLWWKCRRQRVTASNFGRVASARSQSSLDRLSREIKSQNRPKFTTLPCLVGLTEEKNAKTAYIKYFYNLGIPVSVHKAGLCVPKSTPHLASTPDGFVTSPYFSTPVVLEIKCLYDTYPQPRSILQIARERKSRFYCCIDPQSGNFSLKPTHKYYYQVLGELATTGLPLAHFVIYAPRTKEIKVIEVEFDAKVWSNLELKLHSFHSKYFTPSNPIADFKNINEIIREDVPMETE